MQKYHLLFFFLSVNTDARLIERVVIGHNGINVDLFAHLAKYASSLNDPTVEEIKQQIQGKDTNQIKQLPNIGPVRRRTITEGWSLYMNSSPLEKEDCWYYAHRFFGLFGNPYLAHCFWHLLKFNFELYFTHNSYMTIKFFDFNYGPKILPWWLVFVEDKKNIEANLYCILFSIGYLELGYGYRRQYSNYDNISYSLEFNIILPQLDVVFRYSPFIYEFWEGFAIKLNLINVSLINNIASLFIKNYIPMYYIKQDLYKLFKLTTYDAEKVQECTTTYFKVNTGLHNTQYSVVRNTWPSALKRFFLNPLLNVSIGIVFYDEKKYDDDCGLGF